MKKIVPALLITLSIILVLGGCQNNTKEKTTRFDQKTTPGKPQENKEDEKEVKEDKTVGEESPTVKKPEENEATKTQEELSITSSLENGNLKTDKNYNVIRGTTPQETHRIKVNNYFLTKYKPGQKEWSYIAATWLNSLKEGENKYHVIALNREGKSISESDFTINYTTSAATLLPKVGNSLTLSMLLGAFLMMAVRGILWLKKAK